MAQSPLKFTTDTNQRPQWVQWVNWIGCQLDRVGIHPVNLNQESLLTSVQKQTKLQDWGEQPFLEGLQVLLHSLNEEANLSLTGRLLMRQYLKRLLVNRLQIQATLKQSPEILNVPIPRPLFIVGLPRSGTTFLHRLLAQDPKFRWLQLWELMQPCPPPIQNDPKIDPRIEAAQTLTQQYAKLAPAFTTAHALDAQIPEEGNPLFEHAFANILFELRAHVPSYGAWLRAQNMVPQYQYFRQQLQLLSWQWPGQWLLKAPVHLRYLRPLVQVFPDACIVQTHREPCAVVPSVCSLSALVRNMYTDDVDLSEVGKDWLELVAHAYHQGCQYRRQSDAVPICDVEYTDLLQSPLTVVRHIYEFFGDQLSPEVADKMQHWLRANPQHKHGTHSYSLEQFGLSEAAVMEKVA